MTDNPDESLIVAPAFDDGSARVGTPIDVGPIGDEAVVDPVHPYPTPSDAATVGFPDDTPLITELPIPPANEPPPTITPPDIGRVDDDPTEPPPENLARSMM